MTISQWQTHLTNQGASIDQGTVVHYAHAAQERASVPEHNTIYDLSHLTLLELTGADAVNFLQGQVTNDVKLLDGERAHYSGYCSPKGRLLGLFLAFAQQDHLYLQMPNSISEAITKRLRMFVMRSKVNISDTAERIVKIGVNGPSAEALLAKHFSALPQTPYALITLEQATVLKLPSLSNHQRYEIVTSIDHAIPLWNALKDNNAKPAGQACWDWLEIQSGIPEIISATQEQFVPQMVNLDLLNGINFKKGCYTGQEIVARTHYLGTVKRRTFLMHITSETTPQAGDKLFDSHQSEVGQVVRVAASPSGGFDVLAELRIEAQQGGLIYWATHQLTNQAMPYSLGLEAS